MNACIHTYYYYFLFHPWTQSLSTSSNQTQYHLSFPFAKEDTENKIQNVWRRRTKRKENMHLHIHIPTKNKWKRVHFWVPFPWFSQLLEWKKESTEQNKVKWSQYRVVLCEFVEGWNTIPMAESINQEFLPYATLDGWLKRLGNNYKSDSNDCLCEFSNPFHSCYAQLSEEEKKLFLSSLH